MGPKLNRRCAIYTRKSSEEGLDQAFNSLHAQREACEAYVKSQAGEGWTASKVEYDDGGFSGGSMDRPALKRLLADVDCGLIDVVVVYKVDRLTRALADFAKIVERFDAREVSFVSVTQAFNTTSSMGRLTLNVLLSFAQFEREVTGERIRDKLAASKAKGMWMGGIPPLGYRVKDRSLEIVPQEAERVRSIYDRYLQLGSVRLLQAEFAASDARSKVHVTGAGRTLGGEPFGRGALFHLLANPIYVGEIRHKEQRFPGLHAPIVDRALFDAVQARLAAQRQHRRERVQRPGSSPLKGRIVDAAGAPMSPSVAYGKRGQPYRYYVSSRAQPGKAAVGSFDGVVSRVAAAPLEALVHDRLKRILALDDADPWTHCQAHDLRIEVRPAAIHISLRSEGLIERRADLDRLASRLDPQDQLVLDGRERLRIAIAVRPVFRGGRTWLVTPSGASTVRKIQVDPVMVKALRTAHAWQYRLGASPMTSPHDLRDPKSAPDSYVRKLMRLAFLAPDIQNAMLSGRQSVGLTLQQLMARDIPLAWADQRQTLGFSGL